MTEQELFIAAEQAFTRVVDCIPDEQWDVVIPAAFGMPETTVRALVQAHAKDAQWVGHVLSGSTIEDGKELFPDEPLSGDLKAGWRRISAAAQEAAANLDEPDAIVHLSFGDFPAREYLHQITAYRALQTWDLARAVGADDTLPPGLTNGLWEQLEPVAEEWRAMGAFGPAVDVPGDAPLQDRLLGLSGRRP